MSAIIGDGANATFHKQKGAHQCVFHITVILYNICTLNVFAICTYQSNVEYVKKIAKTFTKMKSVTLWKEGEKIQKGANIGVSVSVLKLHRQ